MRLERRNAYSTRTNHNDWALGIGWETERGAANVDGDLVGGFLLVGTARTLDGIVGGKNASRLLLGLEEGDLLAVRRVLEVEQEVGASTEDPAGVDALILDRLVLENNAGNVDRVRVELRTGRNGVVPRLKTRDRRDNDVEGDLPRCSVLGSGGNTDIVLSRELENLSELETTMGDDVVVLFLVRVEVLQESLSLGVRSELGQYTEDLTTCDGADVNVVTEDGNVGRGDGERNFGKRRIEGFDLDDSVLLIVETKSAEQTFNLDLGVGRPYADVVTMLVGDAGVFSVELSMNAVAVSALSEEFASDSDGCRVGVLCVMDALGTGESASRKFTWTSNKNPPSRFISQSRHIPRYTFSAG